MESHLLQMRGLKLEILDSKSIPEESHLLQMRGLKQRNPVVLHNRTYVASFTDAWIETEQVQT